MKQLFILFFSALALTTCGQHHKNTHSTTPSKIEQEMDTSKIANEKVKKAIEALQKNDKNAFYSCFTSDATFTDDGRSLDFKSFFDNAFSHQEKFLSIDQVENDGNDIYGNFHAGQWGTFRVFFKFRQDADGKFNRLDIGQAPK